MLRPGAATDPDIAAVAALLGDRSRAHIVDVLADGSARPAGELARLAGISPQTASAHLDRLVQGKLVVRRVQGRHRYYQLRGGRIAEVLEMLASVAPAAPALTPAQDRRAQGLRFARTCYGHLAGRLGVAVTEALCARSLLVRRGTEYEVTPSGRQWFSELGIEARSLRRRPLARGCVDWSERRQHLAGAFGARARTRGPARALVGEKEQLPVMR